MSYLKKLFVYFIMAIVLMGCNDYEVGEKIWVNVPSSHLKHPGFIKGSVVSEEGDEVLVEIEDVRNDIELPKRGFIYDKKFADYLFSERKQLSARGIGKTKASLLISKEYVSKIAEGKKVFDVNNQIMTKISKLRDHKDDFEQSIDDIYNKGKEIDSNEVMAYVELRKLHKKLQLNYNTIEKMDIEELNSNISEYIIDGMEILEDHDFTVEKLISSLNSERGEDPTFDNIAYSFYRNQINYDISVVRQKLYDFNIDDSSKYAKLTIDTIKLKLSTFTDNKRLKIDNSDYETILNQEKQNIYSQLLTRQKNAVIKEFNQLYSNAIKTMPTIESAEKFFNDKAAEFEKLDTGLVLFSEESKKEYFDKIKRVQGYFLKDIEKSYNYALRGKFENGRRVRSGSVGTITIGSRENAFDRVKLTLKDFLNTYKDNTYTKKAEDKLTEFNQLAIEAKQKRKELPEKIDLVERELSVLIDTYNSYKAKANGKITGTRAQVREITKHVNQYKRKIRYVKNNIANARKIYKKYYSSYVEKTEKEIKQANIHLNDATNHFKVAFKQYLDKEKVQEEQKAKKKQQEKKVANKIVPTQTAEHKAPTVIASNKKTTSIQTVENKAPVMDSVKKSVAVNKMPKAETMVNEITQQDTDNELLLSDMIKTAREQLESKKLTTPKGNNAKETCMEILAIDPDNKEVKEILATITNKYKLWAKSAIAKQQPNKARSLLYKAKSISPDDAEITNLMSQTNELEVSMNQGAITEHKYEERYEQQKQSESVEKTAKKEDPVAKAVEGGVRATIDFSNSVWKGFKKAVE